MPLRSLGPREMGAYMLTHAAQVVGRGARRTWLAASDRTQEFSGGVILYCTGDRGRERPFL